MKNAHLMQLDSWRKKLLFLILIWWGIPVGSAIVENAIFGGGNWDALLSILPLFPVFAWVRWTYFMWCLLPSPQWQPICLMFGFIILFLQLGGSIVFLWRGKLIYAWGLLMLSVAGSVGILHSLSEMFA